MSDEAATEPNIPEESWDVFFPDGQWEGLRISRERVEEHIKLWGWGEPILVGVHPRYRDAIDRIDGILRTERNVVTLAAKISEVVAEVKKVERPLAPVVMRNEQITERDLAVIRDAASKGTPAVVQRLADQKAKGEQPQ
jgi:hypothetical protein